jgi:hypothetical protein
MSDNDLEAQLRNASLNNEQRGITGALVYGDGQFMQIMEREKDVMDTLFATVSRDPRHTELTKLPDKEISHRSFQYTPPTLLTEQAHDLSAFDGLLFQMMNAFGLSQRV